MVSGIVTVRSGSSLRVTFTVTLLPSATVYDPCSKLTVTAGTSSSVIDTTASLVEPSVTPAGRVSKASLTLSPSSLSLRRVAVTVKVFSVSPALNTTLAGTPE